MAAPSVSKEHFIRFPVSRSGDRAPRLKIRVEVQVRTKNRTQEETWHSVNFSRTGLLIENKSAKLAAFPLETELFLQISPDRRYITEKVDVVAIVKRAYLQDNVVMLGLSFKFD